MICMPTVLFFSVARFLAAGVIPVAYWTIRGFAKELLRGVTTTWAILIVLFTWLQYWALFTRVP